MEASIARMLLIGVTLAAILVFFGGALYVLRAARTIPDYKHFVGVGASLHSIGGVLHGVMLMDPKSLIQLGVLLLIATPVFRVIFCVIGFARQRDRIYVLISSSVFMILVYSFLQRSR
jgi:uncharacterized membrane protein